MSAPLPALVGHTAAEIESLLSERPDAKLRAKQLAKWIYLKAAVDFESMHDLPKEFRSWLAERFRVSPLEVAKHMRSTDDVDKLLVHGGDGEVFECVLLPYQDRVSCCISSQVGCPMGCAFCATGLGGFDRNLTAGEIVGQYLLLQRLRKDNLAERTTERREAIVSALAPGFQSKGKMLEEAGKEEKERISHVVFMGMGEPLLNLANVIKALRILHEEVGLSYRHLTVSTVGLAPQIRELATNELPIHLALSLHSPFDAIRDSLMPVNKKWPVAEVIGAMKDYHEATGRKITIEYLLIGDLTDSIAQAQELARLIKGTPNVVNVIPFNWVQTAQGFQRPTRERVKAFKNELKKRGVNVTERMERGHDIAAACGQLAGEHKGRFANRPGNLL